MLKSWSKVIARPRRGRLPSTVRRAFSRFQKRFSASEGSSIVEIAVTMPLILLVMTGIFSFSIALYQKLELANAVATGGRYLASDRGDNNPCASTASQIYSAAPGMASSSLTLTFVLNGVSTGATCAGASGAANSNMVAGGTAEIEASYPCVLQVYGWSLGKSCNLTTQVVEVVQ